jgi:hypothetical protein
MGIIDIEDDPVFSRLRDPVIKPFYSWIITMRIRLALTCATLLLAVSSGSADKREKTHPVQAEELLAVIGQADKIVVYHSTPAANLGGGGAPPKSLYSSTSLRDISELREAITVEHPKGWFRCACVPPIEIMLSRRGTELGVISVQEDLTIGFSRWSGDAKPADQERLLQWFDARGILGPRRGIERILAQEKSDRLASERWLSAMPTSLRPLWPKLMQDEHSWSGRPQSSVSTSGNARKAELAKEFPDVPQRIRALFAWFGSGAGPWSGFPEYEEVPAHLLLEYQPSEVMTALQGTNLTDSEMEGAARFFSGYTYGARFRPKGDKTLIALIPAQLKKSLLEHVLKSGDQDNKERARSAFEQN